MPVEAALEAAAIARHGKAAQEEHGLRQFLFEPGEYEGKPVPVRITYRYRFLYRPQPPPPVVTALPSVTGTASIQCVRPDLTTSANSSALRPSDSASVSSAGTRSLTS